MSVKISVEMLDEAFKIVNGKRKCGKCEKFNIKDGSTYAMCYSCMMNCPKCKECKVKRVIYKNYYTDNGYCTKDCYNDAVFDGRQKDYKCWF